MTAGKSRRVVWTRPVAALTSPLRKLVRVFDSFNGSLKSCRGSFARVPRQNPLAMPNTFDPKFWRDSAAEARAMAERLDDPKSRRILKEIANRYDDLAEQATKRS